MIRVEINSVDLSAEILWDTLKVSQILTSQVDTADFVMIKSPDDTFSIDVKDEVIIYDGATKIFGGEIQTIDENVVGTEGLRYTIKCSDFTSQLDGIFVAKTYDNMEVIDIIEDFIAEFSTGFTTNITGATFELSRIVFNNVSISTCLKRLATLLNYEWYVDADKVVHFFQRFSVEAPFDLQDDSENYIWKTLRRNIDGTQIINEVIVKGGLGTQVNLFTDTITVVGNESKSFGLPFQFRVSEFTVKLNTVPQTIGIDGLDSFDDYDVLYNFNDKSVSWENNLSDADEIEYSGYKTFYVKSIASDSVSIAEYGLRQKLIKDTSIVDSSTARQRAIAELTTYKDAISELNFRTYESGLRTGMVMTYNSTLRGVTDLISVIQKVDFKTIDPETFFYDVQLITAKKATLVEMLGELLRPKDDDSDENAIAEVLKMDLVVMTMEEIITAVVPESESVIITLGEVIGNDTIGLGVEPTWVLADYFPTSNGSPMTKAISQESGPSTIGIYVNNWRGNSFTTNAGIDSIPKIQVNLKKVGTPIGNVVVDLYLADGVDKPTGSILATATYPALSLLTTPSLIDFIFNKAVSASTKYCFVVKADSCLNSSNCVNIQYSGANPYAGGMYCASTNNGTSWTTSAPTDIAFNVFTQDIGDPMRNGLLDISMELY